jgi:hypothetical protein
VRARIEGFNPSHLDRSLDRKKLINIKETGRETTLCLAAAHSLVKLDDGTMIGDPMEKITLEALDWTLARGLPLIFASFVLLTAMSK